MRFLGLRQLELLVNDGLQFSSLKVASSKLGELGHNLLLEFSGTRSHCTADDLQPLAQNLQEMCNA